ncbi:hypothetical protein CHUAL_005557 [Chamberlinius hualienensis]
MRNEPVVKLFCSCLNKMLDDGSVNVTATDLLAQRTSQRLSSPDKMEKSTLKVHFPNGGFNTVKYGDYTIIKDMIDLMTTKLPNEGEKPYKSLYAMKMYHVYTGEEHWLHLENMMHQIKEKYESRHPEDEWRYELHVRYIPCSLTDLYDRDRDTFFFLYEQVKKDYLKSTLELKDLEVAIQICCLEIRRLYRSISHWALDKKSNFEYLEKDPGLHKFIPQSLLNSVKV